MFGLVWIHINPFISRIKLARAAKFGKRALPRHAVDVKRCTVLIIQILKFLWFLRYALFSIHRSVGGEGLMGSVHLLWHHNDLVLCNGCVCFVWVIGYQISDAMNFNV